MSQSSVIVPAPERPPGSPLAGVKHVIAVGSGKGGVGKSTTAINLAVALSELGAKVGLMDADIYGPSLPKLLGIHEAPVEVNGRIQAPLAGKLKVMSMGLLGGNVPAVWRGPMASRAVSQFLGEVDWGELDYLIVDLPPGTGDIQLTLAQSARLSGAIIVMTPQALATDIARKGLKMFQQVRVPVIGLVENMSDYECPKCGHHESIFGHGGGALVAKELNLPLLAQFPIDPRLVSEGDAGKPVVLSRPDSPSAKRYLDLARSMASELSSILSGTRQEKTVVTSMEPNEAARAFRVSWTDGKQSLIGFRDLRGLCPCALCVDEGTGQRKVGRDQVSEDVKPLKVQTVGNYALSIHWSDGHQSGIYAYDYLRKILVKDAG
jgi:ATP-binding protein involved in chromosome partitioning